MISERLSAARKSAGLSLRELAVRAGLSHTAIAKFEKNQLTPSSRQLMDLAKILGVRCEFFFRPMRAEIKDVEYRKKSSAPKKLLDRIHGDVLEQAERWQELLSLYPSSPLKPFTLPTGVSPSIDREAQVEDLTQNLRRAWSLGTNPIPDLIDTIESKGVRVIVTLADDQGKFDGLAGEVDGAPLIVISGAWTGDRQRFTLAHELGHLTLKGRLSSALSDRLAAAHPLGDAEERLCNRFAGAFILPRPAVIEHLGERRHHLEPRELFLLKHEFGLSMQACLFRALDANVIDSDTHQRLFRQFGQRGWRKKEPGAPYPREQTKLFHQLAYRALGEQYIGDSKAAELLGLPLSRFHQQRKLEADSAAAH